MQTELKVGMLVIAVKTVLEPRFSHDGDHYMDQEHAKPGDYGWVDIVDDGVATVAFSRTGTATIVGDDDVRLPTSEEAARLLRPSSDQEGIKALLVAIQEKEREIEVLTTERDSFRRERDAIRGERDALERERDALRRELPLTTSRLFTEEFQRDLAETKGGE